MSDIEPEWCDEDCTWDHNHRRPKTDSPRGRNRRPIDLETLVKLAKIGCTTDEIGKFFGVDGSTIRKRFPQTISQAKAQSKARLRQAQYDLAVNGDKTMLVWLGKQYLNQGDNGERNSDENQPLPWSDLDIPTEFRIEDEIDTSPESGSSE